MQKNIMKDPLFLSQKSSVADPKADAQVVRDLQDTLRANRDRCVGMAANMIGVKKNIIIVAIGPMDLVMLNPRITKKQGPYETEEGCLSHTGTKKETCSEKAGRPPCDARCVIFFVSYSKKKKKEKRLDPYVTL